MIVREEGRRWTSPEPASAGPPPEDDFDLDAHLDPRGCRPGGYPDLELAAELLIGRRRAADLVDQAAELTSRLPRTLAGLAASPTRSAPTRWPAGRRRWR